jgi:protein TonB
MDLRVPRSTLEDAMNHFAMRERSLSGFMLVVALHLMMGYALLTGLGKTLVDVMRHETQLTVIHDPPPPVPERVLPKPTLAPAPHVTIPVQEITIEIPPTIVAPTATPSDTRIAPVDTTASVGGPLSLAPSTVVRKEFKAAYRVDPVYPRLAQREGITGRVVAHLHIAPDGSVTRVEIVSSTHRAFEREVVRALSQWRFKPEPVGFIGEYEIAFNLAD